MPAAGASISMPIGAETSMPSCGRARCRIGCTRSRLLALAEHVQRVAQAGEALAQALNLTREQLVLALERATVRDADTARQRRAAQHEEQQRDNAADTDECLDDGLRHFYGAGGARAVRDQHDGPATVCLLLLHMGMQT